MKSGHHRFPEFINYPQICLFKLNKIIKNYNNFNIEVNGDR